MAFKLSKIVKASLPFGIGTALGGLFGSLNPKQITQDQVPLLTPQQIAAQKKLEEFYNSGVFGNFKAGEDLGLELGDFNMTGIESEGQSALQQLLGSSLPSQFALGDDALKSLLNPDPSAVAAQFDPFKAQVQREIADSVRNTKRNSAYTGNLYSTASLKNLGDVEARGQETLASQLANLTNEALNRRLQAVPLAYQAGNAAEGIKLGRIQASQQFGGLSRQLNDARMKARDAEILRRREELKLPISVAQGIAGSNATFGVPSVTTSQPSTLMQLLQLLVQGGSTILGAKA